MKSRLSPAAKTLVFFAAGLLLFWNVFDIPCLWKALTGIPCPGCGMTRALLSAARLDFLGAERFNILSVPILIGVASVGACAVCDLLLGTSALAKLRGIASGRAFIIFAAVAAVASWVYNFTNNI